MKLSWRLGILVFIAAAGLILISGFALSGLRHTMLQERKTQIAKVLHLAASQIDAYRLQEKSGALTTVQAQTQALQAMRELRFQGDYVFVRRADGFPLVHGDEQKEGKPDPLVAEYSRMDEPWCKPITICWRVAGLVTSM